MPFYQVPPTWQHNMIWATVFDNAGPQRDAGGEAGAMVPLQLIAFELQPDCFFVYRQQYPRNLGRCYISINLSKLPWECNDPRFVAECVIQTTIEKELPFNNERGNMQLNMTTDWQSVLLRVPCHHKKCSADWHDMMDWHNPKDHRFELDPEAPVFIPRGSDRSGNATTSRATE
ncbi:Uu.00g116990.m01.CDS01 [Anthostomella pinea]|uniref:Uu.00g116990.m01.CDS01 n=1 Tax=Anthostomella pinea TaxID=933095 RepID=A0AAI8YGT1_9PEZI|nr:Uu.00g116990.m01.CDS01 [Anthostomella pinea]